MILLFNVISYRHNAVSDEVIVDGFLESSGSRRHETFLFD